MFIRMAMIVILALVISGCRQHIEKAEVGTENEGLVTTTDVTTTEPAETTLTGTGKGEEEKAPLNIEKSTADQALATREEAISEKPTIENIQKALKNADIYGGKIDGIMGPKTKKAIKDFQAQNNLVVDGRVGPKTWAVLKEYLNKASERTGEEKE